MRRVVKKTYGLAILIGNVTADSEFYLTRQGEPKITFRLAVDRCWDFAVEQRGAGTDFFTVEARGDIWVDLELCRGDRVMVIGVPRSRDTKTNGEQRVITYFQPIVIELLHRKDGEGSMRRTCFRCVRQSSTRPVLTNYGSASAPCRNSP